MASVAEREIRDAVADRLRFLMPDARIVHELVVNNCRADLAAIEPQKLTLVEIKSERDKLTRLERQVHEFSGAAHRLIVVAHSKFFVRDRYRNGLPRFTPSPGLAPAGAHRLWHYPEPEPGTAEAWYGWRLEDYVQVRPEPHSALLLGLLWKYELLAECQFHCIAARTRTTREVMIRDMAWHMSGKEICAAVCRQLRARHFPESDLPIVVDGP